MDASVVPSRYRNIACARARANDKIEVINQRALSVDRLRNYHSHHTYYSRWCVSFLEYLRVSNYRYLVPRFHVVLQVTRAYSYDVCLQHSLLPGWSTCIYRIYNIYSILNGSNFVTQTFTNPTQTLKKTVHKRSQTFTNVHKRSQTFTNVHKRSKTFTNVHKRSQTFTNVHKRSQTLLKPYRRMRNPTETLETLKTVA